MSAVLTVAFILFNGKFQWGMDEYKYFIPLGVFLLFSLLAFRFLESAAQERPTLFANRFLMVTMGKLALSIGTFALIAYFGGEEGRYFFALVFILLYIAFSSYLSVHVSRLKGRIKPQ